MFVFLDLYSVFASSPFLCVPRLSLVMSMLCHFLFYCDLLFLFPHVSLLVTSILWLCAPDLMCFTWVQLFCLCQVVSSLWFCSVQLLCLCFEFQLLDHLSSLTSLLSVSYSICWLSIFPCFFGSICVQIDNKRDINEAKKAFCHRDLEILHQFISESKWSFVQNLTCVHKNGADKQPENLHLGFSASKEKYTLNIRPTCKICWSNWKQFGDFWLNMVMVKTCQTVKKRKLMS